MAIRIRCPGCGRTYRVGAHRSGARGRCRNCGATVTVPSFMAARPAGAATATPPAPGPAIPPPATPRRRARAGHLALGLVSALLLAGLVALPMILGDRPGAAAAARPPQPAAPAFDPLAELIGAAALLGVAAAVMICVLLLPTLLPPLIARFLPLTTGRWACLAGFCLLWGVFFFILDGTRDSRQFDAGFGGASRQAHPGALGLAGFVLCSGAGGCLLAGVIAPRPRP